MVKFVISAFGRKLSVEFNRPHNMEEEPTNTDLLEKILQDREATDTLYRQLSGVAPSRQIQVNGEKVVIMPDPIKLDYPDTFLGRFRRVFLFE